MQAYTAGLITVLLWAASFPAISVGLRYVDPVELAAVRFATAAVAGIIWLLWRTRQVPAARDMVRVVACSLLGIALYNVLINAGQRTVSPGAASFIVATQIIFAAALSHVLGQQRIAPLAIAGTVLSLGGVGLISLGQSSGSGFGSGSVLVLAGAACSGTTFVLQRPLALRYGGLASACWTLTVGAVLLAPWLPSGIAQTAKSTEAVAATLFLALGSGFVGYACWHTALAGLGAARAANLLFLMAPVALVIAIPITGHVPDLWTIAGGAAALAGVAIVNRSYRPAPITPLEK